MSQALYRKWRPARFDSVIGQEHVTRTLRNAIASGRSGHAYLFCGPRGTGKTTTARLLAKAVNCLDEDLSERPCNRCANCRAISEGRFLDLIEIDAASNTGVDDIRDLRDKINFSPSEGRFKVYIIDEVHMLSTAAFNALLKTLEEPPPHAKFVLATTEEHKVPMTIKSRCQQFNFRLLTQQEIVGRLEWIAAQEQLEIEAEALALIARQGAGSIRDAESLLDQLVTAPGNAITLERTQMVLGTASNEAVSNLTDAWLDAHPAVGLDVIHSSLASGADARQLARQMVDYLRQVLLLHAAGDEIVLDIPPEEQAQISAQARRATREGLIDAIKAFNQAALASSSSWQPQLPLELAFIELLPEDAVPAPIATRPASARASSPEVSQEPVAAEPAPEETAPVEDELVAESPETAAGSERLEEEPDVEPPPAPEEATAPAVSSQEEKAEPAAPATTVRSELSLETIKSNWATMVKRVGHQDKNLPALLAMCKPLAIESDTLILGFEFPVLKEKFEEKQEGKILVGETMTDLLGQKCRVRCVVSSKYVAPATPRPESKPAPSDESNKEAFYALAEELGGQVQES